MKNRLYLAASIAIGMTAAIAPGARAQTYFVWNSSTASWETSTAWTPSGPPTAADYAQFDANSGLSSLATLVNPIISSADTALSLVVGNKYNGGGWSFTGSGSLSLGNNTSTVTPLNLVGAATDTFSIPNLNLAVFNGTTANNTSGATTAVKIPTSSNLVLTGSTAFNINAGAQTNSGIVSLLGTLTLDDTATKATSNIIVQSTTSGTTTTSTTPILIFDGGTLQYNANAAGGTQTGGYVFALAGFNHVGVNQTGTGQAVLNLPLQTVSTTVGGTTVAANNLRAVTQMSLAFVGQGGVLSDSTGTGPRISFSATPNINTTNRLFASTVSATNATLGFAIETDSNGTNFASLSINDNVSVVSAVNSPSYISGTTFLSGTGQVTPIATSVTQYSPTASETLTGNLSGDTLRITPGAPNLTLDLSTFTNASQGLMLDGPTDYTINGTNTTKGLLGTGSTRYLYVNNPATTLFTNAIIGVGTGSTPTNIIGPGFIVLTGTGTTSQNTATTTSALNFLGGVLRGNNTQLNFTNSGTAGGVFRFYGGTLEITGGANGTGASADFSKSLGTAAGNVSLNYGGAGFSAFGNTASVSIGGATPTTIQWDATSDLPSGSPLFFGSIKSNARLNFLNPINLATATAANANTYDERQITVTGNSADVGTVNGGDFTDIQGAISSTNADSSSNANTDLLKTGTGILQLSGANTYAGNTLIDGGTLVAASSSATGTGTVLVNNGGRLGASIGGGTVAKVVLNPGGVIKPGILGAGDTGATTLTISSALTLNGGTLGSTIAGYSWVLGSDLLDISAGTFSSNVATTTFDFASGASPGTYNLVKYGTLGSGLSAGAINSEFAAVGDTGTFALNANILQFIIPTSSAMPEPGAIGLLLSGLAPMGLLLNRRKSRATNP